MRNDHFKFLAVVGFVVLLLIVIGFKPERLLTAGSQTDAAAVYKLKCAACHTAQAEKFFDTSKTDEELAGVILKGRKDAKPPMPEFASRGVTPEQAKALVVHMRKLRAPDAANANADAPANVNVNAPANVNADADANAPSNTASNTVAGKVSNAEELAAFYKSKCAACHGPQAERSYNPAMPLDQQAAAILKGRKAAKRPPMPAFETKAVTAEKARALAEFMKSLRAAGN